MRLSSKWARHVFAAISAIGVLALPAMARAGISAYCGRLTTEKVMTCVPPGYTPDYLWDVLAQRQAPDATPTPVMLWVEPNIDLRDLAHDEALLSRYRSLVDVAVALLRGKDPASRAVSEQRQRELFDAIAEAGRRSRPQRPPH